MWGLSVKKYQTQTSLREVVVVSPHQGPEAGYPEEQGALELQTLKLGLSLFVKQQELSLVVAEPLFLLSLPLQKPSELSG